MGNPKKSPGEPAASVRQCQGRAIGEGRPRRPKEGGSVKTWNQFIKRRKEEKNCEKIVKNCPISKLKVMSENCENCPINKLKVMTENCEIVQSTN